MEHAGVTNELPPAPYLPTPDPALFTSTALSASGWYADGQHGGVVSALLARAIEQTPTLAQLELARITVELFRVIPVAPLRVSTEVLREGKKIQVVRATLSIDSAGRSSQDVAMAVGVKLRQAHRPLPEDAMPNGEAPGPPEAARGVEAVKWGVGGQGLILFHRFGVEIREVEGSYHQRGPAAVWFRLLTPIVAGEEPSANQRAIVAADFGNGISRQLHPREWMFMNADLTVGLVRAPAGEWVCLRATSWYSAGGRGVVAGELYDRAGPVGRTMQTVFLEPVNPSP